MLMLCFPSINVYTIILLNTNLTKNRCLITIVMNRYREKQSVFCLYWYTTFEALVKTNQFI